LRSLSRKRSKVISCISIKLLCPPKKWGRSGSRPSVVAGDYNRFFVIRQSQSKSW